jgi:hypothetical protein
MRATVSKIPRRPRQIGTKWIVIEGKRHRVRIFESAAARGSEAGWQSLRSTGKLHSSLSYRDHDPEIWGMSEESRYQ